jgi:putative sterol carrier protein
VTGATYNAGMGYFNRAAIVTGPGAVVGNGKAAPLPEAVAKSFKKIKSLDHGEEYPNATVAFSPMLDAFSPKKAETGEMESGLTVQGIFDGLTGAFQADKAAGVDVVFQFDISGPTGGSWTATVKDGGCEVSKGSHDSPTTAIEMGDDDFVKMISGELNAMIAYTSGKNKDRRRSHEIPAHRKAL